MTGVTGVYQTLLGRAFEALHPSVREAHVAPLDAEGVMDVVHGSHALTRTLVRLMHLPAAGTGLPVMLRVRGEIDRSGRELMHWTRLFGSSRLSTRQCARRGLLVEQSGPGRIAYALREQNGALVYEQRSMRAWQVPIWSGVVPRVRARVLPAETGWHVDVIVDWRGHLVCRYTGRMRAVRAAA